MDARLERLIWQRAGSCCEYCLFPAERAKAPFEIDHIIAKKHGGETSEENLALSCFFCNSFKGPNIAGIDPQNGDVVRLFHPRRDNWAEHFAWNGAVIVARTPVGRVTVRVLEMNHPQVVEIRRWLIVAKAFPPRK